MHCKRPFVKDDRSKRNSICLFYDEKQKVHLILLILVCVVIDVFVNQILLLRGHKNIFAYNKTKTIKDLQGSEFNNPNYFHSRMNRIFVFISLYKFLSGFYSRHLNQSEEVKS